jgi:hypothetical protein
MNAIMRLSLALPLLMFCGGLWSGLPGDAAAQLPDSLRERDRLALETSLAALAPQRPGQPDLYVVGVGGDSTEDVFRNEVRYLETLMATRFGAKDRIVGLINHEESLFAAPRPLATLSNLRAALAGVAARMDPEQDLLLLYLTMHGTRDHMLHVQFAPHFQEFITPDELREALDDAGIRNRIVVVSACFAGGFVPELRDPHTLVLTAARKDRTSFGCGTSSEATYFGRAWMIEGLNTGTDMIAAFQAARTRIAEREREEGYPTSFPQIHIGAKIEAPLQAWQAQLTPGPAVPYPYLPKPDAPAPEKRRGNQKSIPGVPDNAKR